MQTRFIPSSQEALPVIGLGTYGQAGIHDEKRRGRA